MAVIKKLAAFREHTGNRQVDAIQRAAKQTADRANACPFFAGVLRSVSLSTTPKRVDHGLGARATFMVVRTNYDGTGTARTVNEASAAAQAGLDLTKQLAVVASGNCTVDLWFYPVASEAVPR